MTAQKLQDGQSGLPTPATKSTHSYWHKEPSKVLLGHRTTKDVPNTADVVVIGSGIAGTFAARELVNGGKGVVLFEAREACWGATGRNGGHCQPQVYGSPAEIARFELGTYQFLKDLVEKNNIPCDWNTVGGAHGIFEEELLEVTERVIKRLQQEHPDLAEKAILVKDKEGLEALRMPHAFGAVYQPNAAKLWPYKLVAWVLEQLLEQHPAEKFNLQTNTPVEHVQNKGDHWVVHTARGQVVTKDVLLASNAYTSYILPKMTGLITPVREQVCGLDAPKDDVPLEHSHAWPRLDGSDYLIQRNNDQVLIFGGERFIVPHGNVGIWDDDEVNPDIGTALRSALHDKLKLRKSELQEVESLHASYEWTGIMGYSKDRLPWVGLVPKSLGGAEDAAEGDARLWICAGFTGHGMPVAARCGIAMAEKILGREASFPLPTAYVMSEKRAEKARNTVTPNRFIDELRAFLEE